MKPRMLQLIAVWQVAGGLHGAARIAWALYHGEVAPSGFAPAMICLTLYVGAFAAGLLLWFDHALRFSLSMATQLLQIPQVVAGGFSFLLVGGVGPQLNLTALFGAFLNVSHRSEWQSYLHGPAGGLGIGINLLALAAFLYLNHARKSDWTRFANDLGGSHTDLTPGPYQTSA